MITEIINFPTLLEKISNTFNDSQIAVCYGHFNLIHPGHIRYLNVVKEKSDISIVFLMSDDFLNNNNNNNNNNNLIHFFEWHERAKNIIQLGIVNYVCVLDSISLSEAIEMVNPNQFILGVEYKNKTRNDIVEAKKTYSSLGKEIFYHSGFSLDSFHDLYLKDLGEIQNSRQKEVIGICEKNNIKVTNILKLFNSFEGITPVVIGDTILDEYISTDPIGMSAEAPVIVVKELNTNKYIGGAAVVANHIRSFCSKVQFISVTGEDDSGNFIEEILDKRKIKSIIFKDVNRKTTHKIRYTHGNQKLFRVSRLSESEIPEKIEEKILNLFNKEMGQISCLIFSDFSYGVLTKKIIRNLIEYCKNKNILSFADSQSSSQYGDISKFYGCNVLSVTEKEARLALKDNKSGLELLINNLFDASEADYIFMKLGPNGFVASERYNKVIRKIYFPALVINPVDVSGAGDSFLSAISIALTSGLSLGEASLLGLAVSAVKVNELGNKEIDVNTVKSILTDINKKGVV